MNPAKTKKRLSKQQRHRYAAAKQRNKILQLQQQVTFMRQVIEQQQQELEHLEYASASQPLPEASLASP
eukprot:1404077-Karenia_brevis.AAC.1